MGVNKSIFCKGRGERAALAVRQPCLAKGLGKGGREGLKARVGGTQTGARRVGDGSGQTALRVRYAASKCGMCSIKRTKGARVRRAPCGARYRVVCV